MGKFAELLEKTVPGLMKEMKVPGAAFSVIENHKLDKIMTFGLADIESNRAVSEETIFSLCSISKSIAAWGVMVLVERKLVDLDVSVENYLTRWHIPQTGYDTEEVTLRRLLSHTAGMSVDGSPGYNPDLAPLTLEQTLSGDHDYKRDDRQKHYRTTYTVDNYMEHVEIMEEPGKRFMYSGGGYTLVQLVVEEVSGMTYADFIDKEVLQPLGMKDSYYDFHKESKLPVTSRYDWDGVPYPMYRDITYAAGGLNANIKDLTKYALATISQDLLKPESYAQMYDQLIYEDKVMGLDCYYGIGHSIIKIGGVEVVFHSGGHPGIRTFYLTIPKTGNAFCMLFNSNNANPLQEQLLGMWAQSLGLMG